MTSSRIITDSEQTPTDLQTQKTSLQSSGEFDAEDESLEDRIITADNVGAVVRKLGGLDVRRSDGTVASSEDGSLIILYGPGGGGKTTLAADAMETPFGSPYLHLDAEGGKDSIIDRKGLEFISLYSWKQFNNVTNELVREKGAGYKTICVDNLVEIQQMSLEDISGKTSQAEIQEWGEMFREVREKIRVYRDLGRKYGLTIIMCCWDSPEKIGKRGDSDVMRMDLALSPALRKQVPGLTTIVGHVGPTNDPNKRLLDFASSPDTVSKFRRSRNAQAQKIPLQIVYGVDDLPLHYILNVLKGGTDWPTGKFEVPGQRRAQQQQQAAASTPNRPK